LKLLASKEHNKAKINADELRTALKETAGSTLAANPQTFNAIQNLARAAYEVRAIRNGWDTFEADEYSKIVRELLGEREVQIDGSAVKYGGISDEMSYDGNGWFGNTSYRVIVPPDVRQDAFDDLMGMLKVSDLKAPPLHITGQQLTDEEFRESYLFSKGNGEYYLMREPGDVEQLHAEGKVYLNKDGTPYVFKFNEVRDLLKTRAGTGTGIFLQ
jgi:hypothetical protein